MVNNKKTIGIMSMQRIYNYGSFLQAYALRKMLNELGYSDVVFVDYIYEKDIIAPEKKNEILKRIIKFKNPTTLFRWFLHRKKFRHEYDVSLRKILGIGERQYSMDVDTLVIGSDEVFNFMQHYPVGYSRNLFGKGYENSRVISYAASFGYTKINDLVDKKVFDEIAEMLKKFKSISVRDDNAKKIINTLLPNKEIYQHLDPVLVGDFSDVINRPVKYNNYIILYAYSGRLSKNEEKIISQFAKKHNKKIISLGFYQPCADYNLVIDPLDLFAYFKNADFVITDTFHGSVFSIKTNVKFCTIIRDTNKNKLLSLLKRFHIEGRLMNRVNDLEKMYASEIDYDEINKILDTETKHSVGYLREYV